MDYTYYPHIVVEDIARLRRRIAHSGLPAKVTDQNLIIGTWNIRAFGAIFPGWVENTASPKRNLRGMAAIAEIARHYDILAIQEVKRDISGLRKLVDWLGPNWGLIVTDVSAGDEGNAERLAFIFDRRRVTPSGLAGEIVLPAARGGDPAEQFARPPYIVGFESGGEQFALLTCHIKYGKTPTDRLPELTAFATYAAQEIRDRSRAAQSGEGNLIVLGDFNIDERGDNPLFKAFTNTGLWVPPQLGNLCTALGTKPKYYDHIAWFMGDLQLNYRNAGVVNFAGAVFPELPLRQMSFRVSDHLPLWAEFGIDRSTEKMARTLGLDPGMPDPLATVPEMPVPPA